MRQRQKRVGSLTRVLEAAGLKYSPDGQPRRASSKRRSRYGLYTSRRLDEDVDELVARIEALEEALRRNLR